MDFRMREALRKSRIYLLDNVIFDVLVDHVIVQDIFADSMLDTIKAGSDRLEQIRRLLDHLSRRPDDCYYRFLRALNDSGHEHCTRFIQEKYVQSGPTQISAPVANTPQQCQPYCPGLPPDEDVPMESSGSFPQENPGIIQMGFPEVSNSMEACPGSFSVPVQESSQPGGGEITLSPVVAWTQARELNKVAAPSPADMTEYQRHMFSNPDGVYRMESSPRGLALVINNEKFKFMSARTGSTRDMENLHALFKKLGFHICHEKDKTAEEMRVLLKSFAEYEPLSTVDALVVIILSHGGRGGTIFGTNGSNKQGQVQDYIRDEEVRDAFSARNCPRMVHKPKLIVIQACRGLNEDMADGVGPSAPFSVPVSCSDQNGHNRLGQDGGSIGSNASTTTSARIANMADICLIHSTVHGYVSYRHPVEGSPFIQEMTQVFQEKADKKHLNDMMTEVNRKLASRQLSEDLRTVPSTTNTLTKDWFFNPTQL